MTNFWPKGIELKDTQSPMEILRIAKDEWELNSDGILTLVFQRVESKSGNSMIIVHAKYKPTNMTATLFSVVHRPKTPYPATIQPKEGDLPNLLKKTYYELGLSSIGTGIDINAIQGRTVENKWVSDTPAEFRTKLEKVFNLGTVKSEILNLVSSSSNFADDDDSKPPGIQTEED